MIIDIAKPDYYVEHPTSRWWDDSWPIKKGDPGRPMILITIGPHKLKAICDMGAGMNFIPFSVYDDGLQLGDITDLDIRVVLPD